MLLTPDGIRFAPHPVVTDTDRDKYCVQRIVDFYQNQPTRYADYLMAAWHMRNAVQQQSVHYALNAAAAKYHVSEKYLRVIWETLNDQRYRYGPLVELRNQFHQLPLELSKADEARLACEKLAAFIQEKRKRLRPHFANLKGPAGLSSGSQSLVLWKNRQFATHRRTLQDDLLTNPGELFSGDERKLLQDLESPERAALVAAYQQFCTVFPDAFYIAERGRAHIDEKDAAQEGKGRLLSAGFHSMMGYFRDDQPLCELILTEEQQRELDQLWQELDFIALAPFRQYSGFIWYERAESSFIIDESFNFVRAEDRAATSQEMIQRFADVYLEKLRRKGGEAVVVEAVEHYFADMNRKLRQLESQLQQAEPKQYAAIVQFAEQAYRRPLSANDQEAIRGFYDAAKRLPVRIIGPQWRIRWSRFWSHRLFSTAGTCRLLHQLKEHSMMMKWHLG